LEVAHIVDNFTKLQEDTWLFGYAQKQYPILQQEADIIFTASEFNYQIFAEGNDHCFLFENAVDKVFIGEPSGLPWRTKGGKPRLGYIGTISQRTDIDLLEYVAKQRPDWTLILAGKTEISLEGRNLLKLPNVRYLGMFPYENLPCLLKSFDVCLIPHRNTDYCKSMSPLKLFQYLASGRPIVSTNIESLGSLRDYVTIADSYQDFVNSIDKVLQEDSVARCKNRIEKAKKEIWENRVQDMFEIVKSHLREKYPHQMNSLKTMFS
jgi:glycosyltransferase involved in cell wall biosynthesis